MTTAERKVPKRDWFRSTSWSADIESAFFQRLRRARDKAQYLRIQAHHLTRSHPRVALRLLDEYFLVPKRFDAGDAQAYVEKGDALVSLDDIETALRAYESALRLEARGANVTTRAYLCLSHLAATTRRAAWYPKAIEALDAHPDLSIFPIDRYLAHGARALILDELGRSEEARSFAALALQAASENEAPLRYHRHLGLVGQTDDDFGQRLKMLAATSPYG